MHSLSKNLILILCLLIGSTCSSQSFRLQIIGENDRETIVIDSLKYQAAHINLLSTQKEVDQLLQKITLMGFVDARCRALQRRNDSTVVQKISLGKQIKKIIITIHDKEVLGILHIRTNQITLPFFELESFLTQTTLSLEEKGYGFAKLKLIEIQKEQSQLRATLDIQKNAIRKINTIVIKQTDKNNFPKGYLKHINKKYKNTLFSLKTLEQIHNEFAQLPFISQLKYPEFLVTKDTTNVYVYLEKKNANTFDGFIGFNNNDTKFKVNGYLDLRLRNILGRGEQVDIYWKSDGNDQKTFNAHLDIPYIFNSPVGIQTELQIFRQDTTFQNTKTSIGVNYKLNDNSKINIGYKTTQSSIITNTPTTSDGYINNFMTVGYTSNNWKYKNKTLNASIKTASLIGLGQRQTVVDGSKAEKQFQIEIQNTVAIIFNDKHSIVLNNPTLFLSSTSYVENELYRFGGFNSVRGFRENSFTAYLMTALLTEYRYTLTPKIYLHSIMDFAFYKTEIFNISQNNNLTGIGFGLGTQTKNGLLRIAVATGALNTKRIDPTDSILHLSYNIKF